MSQRILTLNRNIAKEGIYMAKQNATVMQMANNIKNLHTQAAKGRQAHLLLASLAVMLKGGQA